MDELKNKRKAIKASITRIYNYCVHNEATADGINARMEKLDQYYNEYESIQNSIDEMVETPELGAIEENYRSQVEYAYFQLKAINDKKGSIHATQNQQDAHNQQIITIIDNLAGNQSTLGNLVQTISNITNTSSSTPIIHQSSQNSVQLPRISLPQFDGTSTKWIHFRDLFEAVIQNNNNLSNIEKYEYLQSHLKGDALSLIKHLNLSNENYAVAWNIIKGKYNNSQQLKKEYLKLLFDQPNMKSASVTEMKRLLNSTNEAINALKALNEEMDKWNSVILFHLERKLDFESQQLWSRSAPELPSYKEFLQFLEKRLKEFEDYQPTKPVGAHQQVIKYNVHSKVYATAVSTRPCCNQPHPIYTCNQFKTLSIIDRRNLVKTKKLCFNCLEIGHMSINCSRSCCKICKQKHHTLLHTQSNNTKNIHTANNCNIDENNTISTQLHTSINMVHQHDQNITLLPTAAVKIKGIDQTFHTCRVMLDTGAQVSLVSESCIQRLGLKRVYDNTVLTGIGAENKFYSRGKVQLIIQSRLSNKGLTTTGLCMSQLTQFQPAVKLPTQHINFFKNIELADHLLHIPGPIDVILGADTFNEWSLNKQIVHPSGSLTAVSTIFGWTIIGKVSIKQTPNVIVSQISMDISEQLQKFWELEELNDKRQYLTNEEQLAEEHYTKTVTKLKNGQFMVRLPFKTTDIDFGNTICQATKRFMNIESKFNHNDQLKIDYTQFMNEYINLNHMEIAKQCHAKNFYLPHHAVFKSTSTTTKIRVVFDGSARESNGKSLNVGP